MADSLLKKLTCLSKILKNILRVCGKTSGTDNSKALTKCVCKAVWAYGRFPVENVDLLV